MKNIPPSDTEIQRKLLLLDMMLSRDESVASQCSPLLDSLYSLSRTDDDRDERILDGDVGAQLVKYQVIDVLMKALHRTDLHNYPNFLHRTLVYIANIGELSPDYAMNFLSSGLIHTTISLAKKWSSDDFILISFLGVFFFLLNELEWEVRRDVANNTSVIDSVLSMMETHLHQGASPKIYYHGCIVLSVCLGPGLVFTTEAIFERIVSCVFDGIVLIYDEESQEVGRNLLRRLVGPKAALRMIDHAEMHHTQKAGCSAAA